MFSNLFKTKKLLLKDSHCETKPHRMPVRLLYSMLKRERLNSTTRSW